MKKEHTDAWNNVIKIIMIFSFYLIKNFFHQIWKSGFGLSRSLADGALNGDRINASLYYLASNHRAPLIELHKPVSNQSGVDIKHAYQIERCYEGFSTLSAVKLWKLPLNEKEVSDINYLWTLTLQKHGCKGLIELGVDGMIQAVLLSLGGLKFTHHHLETNLNPRQLHRDYFFRNINYANLSLMSIEVVVGNDNHAKLFISIDEFIHSDEKFFACDAGCIDPPVTLEK